MTLLTSAAITIVVAAVGLLRPVRLRALVYSLPIPMSLVLLTTDLRVGGSQVLGVLLLCGFFLVVTLSYRWLRLNIFVADAAGTGCYVGAAALLALLPSVALLPAVVTFAVGWAVIVPATAALARRAGPPLVRTARLPWPVKVVVVFAAAHVMLLAGQAVGGFVVTFPYSGTLVAVETRHTLPEFTHQFARTCVALLAFVIAYGLAQDLGPVPALAVAWTAFLLAVAVVRASTIARALTGTRADRDPDRADVEMNS